MFNDLVDLAITAGFTWSAVMFAWMLFNMVPRVEVWNWKGLLQDVSVVGFVGVMAFFTSAVSVRRWFSLSPVVTAIAVTLMAILITPVAFRVHQRARGK